MQKIISLSAILATLVTPAFADITGSSNCTEGVLGTSANGSTANIDANWSQNRININWYNGDTKVSESYCMYDDTITLPTQPTKQGYTFAGWTLRAASATPKQCWEITDSTECESSNGCLFSFSSCKVLVSSCNAITNSTDCDRSTIGHGTACFWQNGECRTPPGGAN